MSHRVSTRGRQRLSEQVRVSGVDQQDIDCGKQIVRTGGPRQLIYRRLAKMENMFEGEWPKTVDIDCWHCGMDFEGEPFPVVQRYDTVKDEYDVYGIFCSAPCAKSYLIAQKSNDTSLRLMWQRRMMVQVFGWPRAKPIPEANDKASCTKYGGWLTPEEWRIVQPGVKIRMRKPPFIPFKVLVETESRGITTLMQGEGDGKPVGDTLEEQATQHGAIFSIKGRERPPEDEVVKTVEQLYAKHPETREIDETESVFQTYLNTANLPSNDECERIMAALKEEKQARRKKKTPAGSVGGSSGGRITTTTTTASGSTRRTTVAPASPTAAAVAALETARKSVGKTSPDAAASKRRRRAGKQTTRPSNRKRTSTRAVQRAVDEEAHAERMVRQRRALEAAQRADDVITAAESELIDATYVDVTDAAVVDATPVLKPATTRRRITRRQR